jgi:peptide/nickel transport system permease protein
MSSGGGGTRFGNWAQAIARHQLLRVVARRVALAVPLLFVVSALSFLLVSLTPGDPALQILGLDAPPEAYVSLRHALGLDLPIYEQYVRWLARAFSGNLGTSLSSGQTVTQAILERLPVTLSLLFGSLVAVLVVGVALGVFSAVVGGAAARIVDALELLGFALPSFWVGAVLIEMFAVKLQLFPVVGYVPFGDSPGMWFRALVLPVAALSLHYVAGLAKQTREAMLDVLGSEHIRVAWANGAPARSVFFVYALKNASVRVATILGVITVGLLGGTVLVENVFALPGLGGLLVAATLQHDLPIVQGVTVLFTMIVIAVNLTVDLAYSWLDPRVRTK